MQIMNFDPFLISHTEINSKQILDLTVIPKTIKLVPKKKKWKKINDFGFGKDILYMTQTPTNYKRKKH